MLDYEWGNPSAMMNIAGEEPDPAHHHHHGSDPTRPDLLSHYNSSHSHSNFNDNNFINNGGTDSHQAFSQHHHYTLPHHQPLHLYDPRAYTGASSYAPMVGPGAEYVVVPKSEELIGASRIGLNLGGRTYFSSAEDDFMSRLYRRPRALDAGPGANSPRCQAEGCNADLSHAKHYHRRHKVCEFHSKASTVIAAGLTQRFCQQCSRFHLLSEFDNGKRSCRKRLADHNRRRRKTQQQPNQEILKSSSSLSNVPTMDHSISRSPPDSGAPSSSSVTVAVSPPRMSLDCFRQRSTYQTTASSGSSSSLFFSSG